jgi:hypothetical protein
MEINNNKNQETITIDQVNNVIVKHSSGTAYIVNGINYIVGEKKIKKISVKKVQPQSTTII